MYLHLYRCHWNQNQGPSKTHLKSLTFSSCFPVDFVLYHQLCNPLFHYHFLLKHSVLLLQILPETLWFDPPLVNTQLIPLIWSSYPQMMSHQIGHSSKKNIWYFNTFISISAKNENRKGCFIL